MKDEKAKYLIVDSTEIHKKIYNMRRVFAFNDWNNVYTPDRVIDAKEIFDKYSIPEQFQKIIVKINVPFFIKCEAEEYTMGFPFDMTGRRLEKESGKKYINVSNAPIFYDNWTFYDKIKFRTQIRYLKYDEVFDFLSKIYDSGYLRLYMQAINDFFDNAVDLDYIYEVWDEENDAKKTLARYKQKYSHK